MFRRFSFSAGRHTWTISAVVGVLLLACSQASAQSPVEPPGAPIPVLPPLEREEPSDQTRPRGQMKVGPVKLTPGFGIRDLGIDTNVFNQSTDRKQDFTMAAGPNLETQLELGRLRITGNGELTYVYYPKYETERGLDRAASGLVELRASRRLLLYGNQIFRNSKERLNLEVDVRARRMERGVQVGALVGITPKLTTEFAGTLSTRRFADDASAYGIQLNRTLNEDAKSVAARLALVVTRLTTVFLTGESSELRYPLSPDRDRYVGTATVGASFKPRALFAGIASVGFQRVVVLNTVGLNYVGPFAKLDLRYRLRDATQLGVVVARHEGTSFEPDHPYTIANEVGGSIRQHLFRNVDLYLEATNEALKYAQSPLLHDSRWAGTDVGQRYRATIGMNSFARTRLDVTLDYTSRASGRAATANREYDRLRVGARFSVGQFRIGSR